MVIFSVKFFLGFKTTLYFIRLYLHYEQKNKILRDDNNLYKGFAK